MHASKGGQALVLEVADLSTDELRLLEGSPKRAVQALRADGEALSISTAENPTGWTWAEPDPWTNNLATLWTIEGVPFIVAEPVEQGLIVHVADGTGATNRLIDREDNAAVYLGLVRQLAGPGHEVLILDAANGPPIDPALIDYLGAWAPPSWYQGLFLTLVVVLTLGVRFGLPDESRPPQRGTRDLVDALAGTYARARATDAAASTLLEEADRAIRSRLKLTRDAPASKRDEGISEELRSALRAVEVLGRQRAPESVAVPAIRKLEEELARFLAANASDARRKR